MHYLIFLFALLSCQNLWAAGPWALVRVPVADVRAVSGTLALSHDYDPNQETQILYGETVRILEREGDWLRIEAPEQPEYSHKNAWQGYPGWILDAQVAAVTRVLPANCVVVKSASALYADPSSKNIVLPLSLGTRLNALNRVQNGFREIEAVGGGSVWIPEADVRALNPMTPEQAKRDAVVQAASQFLGTPYFWGGRSAPVPGLREQVTGVDCSGLVNLAYRAAGMEIPRDAMEQSLKAKKIAKKNLKKGDLIFSAAQDRPDKITHVAVYLDEKNILEAPQTGQAVRVIEFQKKYGVPLAQYKEGKPAGDRVISFGTFFGSKSKSNLP